MIKFIIGVLLTLVGYLLLTAPSHAVVITAQLQGWDYADAQVSGSGVSRGGVGEFQITGGQVLPPSLNFLIEQATFKALCLEPDEFISFGEEYAFNIINLSESSGPSGPPGSFKKFGLLSVLDQIGVTRIEDIDSPLKLSIAQITAWEAAGEEWDAPLDPTSGALILTGLGLPQTVDAINNIGPHGLDGWRLENWGPLDDSRHGSAYRGQDFMVSNVPLPAAGWLFFSAIAAVIALSRRKTYVS